VGVGARITGVEARRKVLDLRMSVGARRWAFEARHGR